MKDGNNPGASKRTELWRLFAGFAVIAVGLHLLFGLTGLPAVLAVLSVVAFAGAAWFARIGHDVYLVFSLVALLIGNVVSRVIVGAMYLLGIVLLGSVGRIFGMNKLERDFERCRAKTTMLVDAAETTSESFRRQS